MNSKISCRTKSPLISLAPLTVIVGIAVFVAATLGPSTVDQRSHAQAEDKGKAPQTTGKNQGIEGTWSVVSVEFAGQPLEGLNGATLAMADGKKTFTLPSGAVEKGTYVLDGTKTPKQIDAMTDGKEGTQTGIYAISGDTLKLCLSQQGRQRPDQFATQKDSDTILIVLERQPAQPAKPAAAPDAPIAPGPKPVGERRFRLGFTGFVYDMTPEAVAASRKFVRENGDIVAHHIEGVPWAESLAGQPFSKAFLDEWAGKKAATPPGGKVYLAISPGRGELKLAEKCLPLPKELQGKTYDDPLVKKAFLNYARRAIEYFRPDYLAIGIEVNEISSAGPAKWKAYAALHQYVYGELKKEHKDLPVFASFTLHNMFKHRGPMLAEFQKLMPYNDLVAVSYYPFFMGEADRLSALDWLTDNFDQFGKPYAMVETNDAAERLEFPKSKLVIGGSPAKQLAYYEKLLAVAQKRHFVFVISFIHQDYDALWERIKGISPELFIAWRDCGLLDEKGKARPAYRVWKDYLSLPLKD
ncbi:MAG: TIGR03067 domain-containing protein [Pirellulales bacterium]